MRLKEIIEIGFKNYASDIHFKVGLPPVYRIDGKLVKRDDYILTLSAIENFAREILGDNRYKLFVENKDIDFSYSIEGLCRCRVNVFSDLGAISIAVRLIPFTIPDISTLFLPSIIKDIARYESGLVLITGLTGSGKSTTISTIIDIINKEHSSHIITIEDPIEYLYSQKKSIINQREVGTDVKSFPSAIRGALRQDPDIIVIGEIRDSETISAAIHAAETGHLVISTIHTNSIMNTISRLIDAFPAQIQNQIRTRLASVLTVVVSQKLLPLMDEGRIVATEVMVSNDAVRNTIRENKLHQINNLLQTGDGLKMHTMDQSLLKLYKNKKIEKEILIRECKEKDFIKNNI